MSLPKRARTGVFDEVIVNVWDITIKQIAFTGNSSDAANFIGIQAGYLYKSMSKGYIIGKKWKVKVAKKSTP